MHILKFGINYLWPERRDTGLPANTGFLSNSLHASAIFYSLERCFY